MSEILKVLDTVVGSAIFFAGSAFGILVYALLLLAHIHHDKRKRLKAAFEAAQNSKTITLTMDVKKEILNQDLSALNMSVQEYGEVLSSFMAYPWTAYAKGYTGAKFFVKDKLFTVYVSDISKKTDTSVS